MTSINKLGLDMNDPSVLSYYSQILLFKNDTSKTLLSFETPTKPQQMILQLLAHALDLEYDHNTLVGQAFISREGFWKSSLNASTTETPTTWGNLAENQPNIMQHSGLGDFMTGQPNLESYATGFLTNSPFSPGTVGEGDFGIIGIPPFGYSCEGIENLRTSQVKQDLMPGLLDDVSVDSSIYTVPSLSETSGIAQISSTSDLYSSRDPSSRNLHDGHDRSSIVNNNRRSSCHSIQAAVSGFFGGSHSAISGAPSVNSMHSEWGRSRVEKSCSRRSSIRSGVSSGFSYFDSRSDRSGSQISLGSGRRGPLGKVARATMKAVAAVKACWRCKVLRKACNPETPCDTCPKDARRSDWHTLGCKRGDIKDHMLPVVLCPQNDLWFSGRIENTTIQDHENELEAVSNQVSQQGLELRDEEIRIVKTSDPGHKASLLRGFLDAIGIDLRSLDMLRGTPVLSSSRERPLSPSMAPLDDCILMITWELLFNPEFQALHNGWTLYEFFNLLISAALCQVETGNRLIAQSFICLRSCLEALRVQSSGHLGEASHQVCAASLCSIQCIASLDANLSNYLKELSRVFFAKENMRDIKLWWMSGFYSFCIQSIVRRGLLQLVGASPTGVSARYLAVEQYLHVAVRLFVASSRIHDPLVCDLPGCEPTCTEEEVCKINECKLAQISVKQPVWKENGIKGSGHYLKRLFEDTDQALLTTTAEGGTGDLCPEFDASFKPYSWITKFNTVFLIADSETMSNSGSWNEVSGALSSIMFLVNRYHNYGIDIHFQNHKSLGWGDLPEGIAAGGHYGIKNIATVIEIFKKIKPAGSAPISARLHDIVGSYLAKLEIALTLGDEMKPLNLIVITDGVDNGEAQREILFISKRLDEIHAPLQQMAVQFFEVRNDRKSEVPSFLDKGSKSTIDDDASVRDIVSRVVFTEDSQLTGEGILTANLEAWLRLLE